jgi:ABC-type multidrug transport system permease subunit
MGSGIAVAWSKAGAIFTRDAKLALSYEAQFAMQFVGALAEVVIMALIATMIPPSSRFGFDGKVASFFSYSIVNIAFVNLQTTALMTFSKTVREGQLQGTLEALIATPTSLPLVVLSSGLWAFTLTSLTSFGMLAFALLFGLDLSHTNVATLALFLVLTVAALSPLGVLSAAATMVLKQNAPFDFALSTLSYMFAGVYLPVSLLPQPLQLIGWLLPITHALNGLRAAVAGASPLQVEGEITWLVVATAILGPLSLTVFDRAVRHARADGTLGSY